jgi:Rrf2 family nitric oxide-sensitive transcriptional repressor
MYLSHKNELATIAELAQAYHISENYLMKVVHHLSRKGYISTYRGKGGGMKLARSPADINLANVIEDCEVTQGAVECMRDEYDGDCPLMPRCELRRALYGAQQAFLGHLRQFTLQDLAANTNVQKVIISDVSAVMH